MRIASFLIFCGLIVFSFPFIGCQKADDGAAGGSGVVAHDHDHDHGHEHPKSLLEGYQMLSDLHGRIQAAFENDDPDEAHDELHEVAHILDDDIPVLIDQADSLSDEHKRLLKGVISKLFEEFSKLDDVMHGGPEVDFPEVDSKIQEAMAEMKALIQ